MILGGLVTHQGNCGEYERCEMISETAVVSQLPKLAYGREEAADALAVSPATIDRLVKRGLLHPCRATRRVLFSRAELERFLAETSEVISL